MYVEMRSRENISVLYVLDIHMCVLSMDLLYLYCDLTYLA